jgi:hypothetical protein
MEFKVFTRGTYFYIIDENGIEYEGLKKDVRVRRLTSNSSEFYFDNINGWTDPKGGVDVANIVKEDGSPYSLAEFIEFKESETGNFNAGGETPQETETNIVAIADGYSYTNESGEVVNITQKRDISDINNQKIETLVNGVKVFEFPLYTINNDVQIDNNASEWNFTDDQITIVETNGDTQVLNFPYRVTVLVNPDSSIAIRQNNITIGNVPAPAVDASATQIGLVNLQNQKLGAGVKRVDELKTNRVSAVTTNDDLVFLIDTIEALRIRPNGRVGVNTSNPIGALQVNSTTGAFVPPRLTSAQRDLLVTPLIGSVIFNTTTNTLQTLNSIGWVDNSGGSGGGSGKIFTRTQWSRTLVAPLNVNNGVVLNLLNGTTTLRESDKLAAGTDDFDTLSILPNGGVIVPWNGIIMHHTIRVSFEIVSGSDQEYRLELRRVSDNSVIGAAIKLNRNTDFSGCLVDFETYTASSTDPFVTGGFYIALNNVSGQSAQIAITTPINVYINTTYQTLRQI